MSIECKREKEEERYTLIFTSEELDILQNAVRDEGSALVKKSEECAALYDRLHGAVPDCVRKEDKDKWV